MVFRWPFGDHHQYHPNELRCVADQALLQGAELLVTTEKDWINCPAQLEPVIAPLRLMWLEIEYTIEEEGRFRRVRSAGTCLRARQ